MSHTAESIRMDLLKQVCEDAWCSLKQLLELSDSDIRRLISEELCYPVMDRPRLRRAWEAAKHLNEETSESDGPGEAHPFRISSVKHNKRKRDSYEACHEWHNVDPHPAPSTAKDEPRSKENSEESDTMRNKDVCEVCRVGGDLICCDVCILAFHLKCHIPSLNRVPDGKEKLVFVWFPCVLFLS